MPAMEVVGGVDVVDRGITCGCFGWPTSVPSSAVGSAEPANPAFVKPDPRSRTTGWLRSKREVIGELAVSASAIVWKCWAGE